MSDWQKGEKWRDLALFIDYNPSTGVLTWKARPEQLFPTPYHCRTWNTRYAGTPALAKVTTGGYHSGRLLGRYVKAHRVAWALHYGKWPDGVIDHINGDTSDNRIANLRDVSQAENLHNCFRSTRNRSGATGVRRVTNSPSWQATIRMGGRSVHLGCFRTIEEAIAARKRAEIKLNYHENHGRPSAIKHIEALKDIPAPVRENEHASS